MRLLVEEARTGEWIQTVKGRKFWPLDARPGDFDIEEIAHALSNLCRFGGHTRDFYSVSQHCVLVSQLVPLELARDGLMHDAAEAYLIDLPRPIKYAMPTYLEAEHKMEVALAEQFGLDFPWHPMVKAADNNALVTEARDLLGKPPEDWTTVTGVAVLMRITPLDPRAARNLFLERWYELNG